MPPRSFIGTSDKGDLGEAIAAALTTAKAELHSDIVRWEVSLVNGLSGGVSATNRLQVTLLADTPQAQAMEGGEVPTATSQRWTAWHDRMPGYAATLHIDGECEFPTPGFAAALRPAHPQGPNPLIYLMDLIVVPPLGPAPPVVTRVPVQYSEQTAANYAQVQVRPANIEVPVGQVF
jgi:hypothetical protein